MNADGAPEGAEPETAQLDTGPGQTLFAFVRHWSRRWNGPADHSAARQGRLVLVTEAVHALQARGRTPVTVNAVAREIGIDQSGASRLVKDAVDAGHLELRPSADDARRREASVTAAGTELLRGAHRWQEEVFGLLTEEWTEEERTGFHRAMVRLLDRSHVVEP
ncbi:MarR family winged helix-turn-helix transcriptional regulator [Nocardiopsis sp. RSe5-2]|uniref:MarR family winged helix-turn-helix transcriptional regulator n=1 Tax=Nocardiopsis endophytica TaxID=3018445 RepID=A0ABT4U998_9ACTN|nr:MarR family winged helix-turn-helix transcriptional regulator [Nocardiopsis endophytica]MDA2812922.1 MarR family winged helix-turn-helix transcriptional regulator [Nocardiopsis endophytica]